MSVILSDRVVILGRCECPTCGAQQGWPCHSRFHNRPMENEVHRERSELANATATRRGGAR